jgi:hypothetical protein
MAQPTGGTLIANPVRPNDLLDAMATAFANEVKGGNHGYATIAERDAIIEERREWGMLCAVYDNAGGGASDAANGTYVLSLGVADMDINNDANWVKTAIPSGSGAGGTPGSGGGHIIEDEGTPLTQRADLNFVGAGVTATDSGGKTVVTIPGGGGSVYGSTSITPEYLSSGDIDSSPGGQPIAGVNNTTIYYERVGKTVHVSYRIYISNSNLTTYFSSFERAIVVNLTSVLGGTLDTSARYDGVGAVREASSTTDLQIGDNNSFSQRGQANATIGFQFGGAPSLILFPDHNFSFNFRDYTFGTGLIVSGQISCKIN